MIQKLLSDDAKELISCLEVGAYKACMILCGSILETILLDWLSELENTNYFVDDDNMQINLYGVIRLFRRKYTILAGIQKLMQHMTLDKKEI